jgi:NAD dependent epimerase/dehydratase family enzyme
VSAIAKQLNKPIVLPNIPGFAISLMLGEMAQLVLESQKVQSDQWHDLGFKFLFPSLAQALKDLL